MNFSRDKFICILMVDMKLDEIKSKKMNMEVEYTTNSWMGIKEDQNSYQGYYSCHHCNDNWPKSNEFLCINCENSFCGECVQFSKSEYGNYLTCTCNECN